ncbi:MAG: LuxR C-terminal-related transcriptional regulator [Firmicutes bacterium]|nr:LuxR C-terminal-related transcriptional regulator [Bacillota bacterium]
MLVLLIATDLSRDEMAQLLFVSRRTVDRHTESIFEKLDVTDRCQLIRKAFLPQNCPARAL